MNRRKTRRSLYLLERYLRFVILSQIAELCLVTLNKGEEV